MELPSLICSLSLTDDLRININKLNMSIIG